MKKKLILVLLSDPNSISEKIILNSLNLLKNSENEYMLIGSSFFFKKLAKKTFLINSMNFYKKKKINFYDIKLKNITMNKYINLITNIAIELLKKKKAIAVINMPLNKKILDKKTPGYTEFFSKKLNQLNQENMLIFSDNLAVCPITTHVPIRKVNRLINKKTISNAINNINTFYKKIIKKKINIKVCGLNPHAGKDFFYKNNEENKIIIPALKSIIKKNKNVSGPHSADTVFFNYKNTVIVGMYHDQVLGPIKTIKGFNAINITIGIKYIRLSPDHGTGSDILKNKKRINNKSFKFCIKFCETYLNV